MVNIDGLEIPCWLDWLSSTAGIIAIVVSLVLGIVATIYADKLDRKEEQRKYGWRD